MTRDERAIPSVAQRIRERLDTWAMPGVKWLPIMSGITEDGHLSNFEAYIAKAREFDPAEGPKPFEQMRAAILAALDVHKPEPDTIGYKVHYTCASCRDTGWGGPEVDWPCTTVEAIAAALGIAIHDSRIEDADG